MSERRVILAEYFTTSDSTVLFVVRTDFDQPQVKEIDIPVERIRKFATANFGGQGPEDIWNLPEDEWQEGLRGLVTPVLEWAEKEDVIWFVPHDVIHYLPLHAIKVEGEYLIERNPVCYSPSASVMRYCQSKRKERRKRALILADSRAERPMAFAREQALGIGSLPGLDAEVYLGSQATKTLVKQKLIENGGDIDILHFACHGYFDSQQALKSGIMLAPEDKTGEASLPDAAPHSSHGDQRIWDLTAEEIFDLEMQAYLVTLSACESGVNERRPGDELIGLTRALIYAGTPSVVVSLWSVDELSTDILMRKFYESLLEGETNKVDALRESQKYLRRMTMEEAIKYVQKTRERPKHDARTASYLDLTIAEIRLAARDYAAALKDFQDLEAQPELEVEVKERAGVGVGQASFGLKSSLRVDYDRPLYDHPFFWAPFILVGDWK
jgi:CHAT domain-containing protein